MTLGGREAATGDTHYGKRSQDLCRGRPSQTRDRVRWRLLPSRRSSPCDTTSDSQEHRRGGRLKSSGGMAPERPVVVVEVVVVRERLANSSSTVGSRRFYRQGGRGEEQRAASPLGREKKKDFSFAGLGKGKNNSARIEGSRKFRQRDLGEENDASQVSPLGVRCSRCFSLDRR